MKDQITSHDLIYVKLALQNLLKDNSIGIANPRPDVIGLSDEDVEHIRQASIQEGRSTFSGSLILFSNNKPIQHTDIQQKLSEASPDIFGIPLIPRVIKITPDNRLRPYLYTNAREYGWDTDTALILSSKQFFELADIGKALAQR